MVADIRKPLRRKVGNSLKQLCVLSRVEELRLDAPAELAVLHSI